MRKGMSRQHAKWRPPRPPITQPHRLKKYADEHLAYEVSMFFRAILTRNLAIQGHPGTIGFVKNACVEAFVNHFRNLAVFLYPDAYRLSGDDVAAHHFLAHRAAYATWVKVRPSLSRTLKAAKQRADKEFAHLTSRRISGARPFKAWAVVSLGDEIRAILKVFVANADPARLGTIVGQQIPIGAL